MNFPLGRKIIIAGAVSVIVATAASVSTVYILSVNNRVAALKESMSSVLEQSETVASNMDEMHSTHAFDTDGLLKAAAEQAKGRPLSEVYSETAYYNTIPIVASWRSVERAAKKNGFAFYTPSRPGVPARNPKNNNGREFEEAFQAFAAGKEEFFHQDKTRNEITLARPIRLSASCLTCHGDPARSRSADGKDPIGFPMEGLKAGDIKGAFVLRTQLTGDPVIKATMGVMTLVGAIVVVGVLGVFAWFNRRFLIGPLGLVIKDLDTTSTILTNASAEVGAASQTVAAGASQQAASLEETGASLEEISSMTRRNADNAEAASQITSQARSATEQAVSENRELKTALSGISQAQQDLRIAVEGIKSASTDVSKIIKTIDEIAFQTNILALNAAVEAARAGESGAGFAVVADEVRNLAQRSAAAARETSSLIETAIARSDDGVKVTEKVSEAINQVVSRSVKVEAGLEAILQKSREVEEQMAQIAAASKEQNGGISQVNVAVSEMDKVTQSNAAGAEEGASAAEELRGQALALRRTVENLQQLSGATDRTANDGVSSQAAPATNPPKPTGPLVVKQREVRPVEFVDQR